MHKRIAMAAIEPLLLETLAAGGEVTLTVTGVSMRPMLRHGEDRIVLKSHDGRALKKYELPLYCRADGRYVLHRIVGVKRTADGVRYTALGDNQTAKEHGITPDRIVGIAVAWQRGTQYYPCSGIRYGLYCRLWYHTLILRRIYRGGKRILRIVLKKNGDHKA
ncbi:MAG: hypothetical protein QM689_09860 [Oscillospiraceae bacterium]